MDQLLGLIQQIYAAPGSREGWHAFLVHLCAAMDGSAASFISHNVQSHRGQVAVTAGLDPAMLRAYEKHWGALDPWMYSPKLRKVDPQQVVVGDELISQVDMKRTGYYADFARQYDIVRLVGAMVESGPHLMSVVSVNGGERRGPFGQAETALLEALVPHLRRGLQLHRRLVAAETSSDSFASVIDGASHAMLFLDAQCRVMFMNRAAQRLVATRDGLIVEDRELRTTRPADTSHLRHLLADAAATSTGQNLGAGGAFALGRPSGRRPLMVLVLPVSRRRTIFPGVEPPVAMVIVTDPERVEIPEETVLRTLLGLTPAEATLTRLLAQGVTLDQAAIRLSLRTATVRTRLKSIFEKTDTHRQSDLVRLVLSGIPRL